LKKQIPIFILGLCLISIGAVLLFANPRSFVIFGWQLFVAWAGETWVNSLITIFGTIVGIVGIALYFRSRNDVAKDAMRLKKEAAAAQRREAHATKKRKKNAARAAADALAQYRQRTREEWSKPKYGANDQLFTELSVLVDKGEDEAEQWQRKKQTYPSLPEAITKNSDHKVFVLLGAPGSGKSTLLRQLDLETARDAGSDPDAPFSYFVSLNQYRRKENQKTALEWLTDKWESDWRQRNGHIQTLDELLSKPGSYLLLDALNEMPRGGTSYNELVDEWTRFIAEVRDLQWQCCIVFSCRALLYSNRLSTEDIRVPHIDIQALKSSTILAFLAHYTPGNAASLFRRIEDADQLDLYSTAYFLKMLVEIAGDSGEIPGDRADLITAYVRKLLSREFKKKTPLIASAGPLAEADVERLGHLTQKPEDWRDYELLEQGALFPRLSDLAFAMQSRRRDGVAGDEHFQLVVEDSFALEQLTPAEGSKPSDLLQAACELSILEHNKSDREVQFIHQLIQEYFAGRRLAQSPAPDLVRLPWRANETPNKHPKNINEPLPPADSTGWEETTLFAALMSDNPDRFIAPLIDANLPLAGRAAAQVRASDKMRRMRNIKSRRHTLPTKTVERIQEALGKRMIDTTTDFRVRIASGRALGKLGHPDLKKNRGQDGAVYLTPPIVKVACGTYDIGRDKPVHTYEGPAHQVKVGEFHIARFPVTNAEWACFMRDGGYREPRWWKTQAAEDWRTGDSTYVCRTVQWYAFRQMLQESKQKDLPGEDYLTRKLASMELSPKEAENHYKALNKTNEEFAKDMRTDFAGGPLDEPRRWRDRNFNNPLQPVVGICWYEAIAYCEWLSDKSGRRWRLPTEVEWEIAARMRAPTNAEYPWGGEFTTDRCNTFESHIRATTPVGLYLSPAGDDRELADISGNAYEWTLSRYDKEHFKYPYRADDGREEIEDNLKRTDPVANEMVERMRDDVAERAKSAGWTAAKVEQVLAAATFYPRVLRGGSFYYSKDEARVTFRLRFHPGYHNQSTGLRLVREV
jgi:formylglycine-generating enzyme required for sulfatase activity